VWSAPQAVKARGTEIVRGGAQSVTLRLQMSGLCSGSTAPPLIYLPGPEWSLRPKSIWGWRDHRLVVFLGPVVSHRVEVGLSTPQQQLAVVEAAKLAHIVHFRRSRAISDAFTGFKTYEAGIHLGMTGCGGSKQTVVHSSKPCKARPCNCW
jgi:hypothetical protein